MGQQDAERDCFDDDGDDSDTDENPAARLSPIGLAGPYELPSRRTGRPSGEWWLSFRQPTVWLWLSRISGRRVAPGGGRLRA
ncbi:MAG TPA: hypothetical protein PKI77_03580 [Mycobacterium sp.]|nr:hypothetical protein [Mycobacterium sp.]